MSFGQILKIAGNEFALTVRNPVMPAFVGLLFVISMIIAFGSPILIKSSALATRPLWAFLTFSIGNSFYPTYLVLITLSVCLGVFTISDERMNGALNTLICKPLYRRDIITGKFLGISGFILISVLLVVSIITSLTLMMFPAAGTSIIEIIERVATYAFILFLICIMTLAFTMLIGIILKRTALSLAVSLTTAYIIQNPDALNVLGPIQILVPWYLFNNIFYLRRGLELFIPITPYGEWLTSSIPLIVLLIAEIVIVVLTSCLIFNREETK